MLNGLSRAWIGGNNTPKNRGKKRDRHSWGKFRQRENPCDGTSLRFLRFRLLSTLRAAHRPQSSTEAFDTFPDRCDGRPRLPWYERGTILVSRPSHWASLRTTDGPVCSSIPCSRTASAPWCGRRSLWGKTNDDHASKGQDRPVTDIGRGPFCGPMAGGDGAVEAVP